MTSGREQPAIGTESEVINPTVMSRERENERARLTIPNPHSGIPITPGGCHPRVIRAEGHTSNHPGVSSERERRSLVDYGSAIIARWIPFAKDLLNLRS